MSTATTLCPEQFTSILIFLSNNFLFNLSHGLGSCVNGNYAVLRTVCEHYKFSLEKFFLQSTARARQWSQRQLWSVQKSFRKTPFFNLSNGNGRGVIGIYAVPRTVRAFLFSCRKFFSQYLNLWMSHEQSRTVNGHYAVPRKVWAFKFSLKMFFLQLSYWQGRGVNGNYAEPRTVCEYFNFSLENFFFNLSHWPWEVSSATTRCQEQFASIYIFLSKIFSSICRTGQERCHQPLRGTQNSLRAFIFFSRKFFLQSVVMARRRVSGNYAVPRIVCEHFKFFTRKFISSTVKGHGRGFNGNNPVPITVCEHFYFSVEILFLKYLIFWKSHGQGKGVNGSYAVPRNVCQYFYFSVNNFFFNIFISENGMGKAVSGNSAVSRSLRAFLILSKFFSSYIDIWMSQGQGRGVNGN